ncbi:uncharacterized protein LOC124115575 isoform X2 [Haliotis rufescens]|uniref:uncharacterized protein LOC124115575 isoform X2 n=1 Tax=Haliotis rufescens TaxID=6454 RepID=UPI00201F1262|nr:uncharacterized protein LOC124115575 isoform X2 [Haliotis rufescens]
MSTHGTPKVPGNSSNGSNLPEARTSFQSTSPRAIMSSPAGDTAQSKEPQDVQSTDEHEVTEKELLQQPSQSDSVSEEFQYQTAASSFENLQPQMASTPVKGGRNVSMTKMLMSSEQYFSALELTNDTTYETERAYEDNPVEEEKPSLSQYTPARESLHNSREETVVDKKESVSSSVEIIEKYSGPGALTDFVNPYKLGVRSSTESKDSDQNESSEDVSNDKDAAVNSDVSMSDVKSQGSIEDDPETGIRGGCRPKTAVGQLQKESDSSILLQRKGSNLKMRTLSSADITVVKDAESTAKTHGVKETISYVSRPSVVGHSVDSIVHHTSPSPRKIQSENYASIDPTTRETVKKSQSIQVKKTVNTGNVHGHAMQSEISEKTNVTPEVEKLKKIKLLEIKMDDTEKKIDKKDNTDRKAFLKDEKPDVRSAADTGGKKVVSNILSDGRLGARIGAQASRKQASSRHMTPQTGTAIGLRPSVGEYKSPGLLLREKQRKEAERNLFSNDEGSSKPPVIISYWRKGDKVMSPLAKSKNTENNGNESVSTQSFSSDNSDHSSTSNISEHAAKSVFSGPGDKVQMVGDLVSHYSGEKYNTPLKLLQRHVDRMRSTSQEKFKKEEKGFKQDSTTSKYAVDESVTCDSPIILNEEQERDGKSQEPLEKDVSSEQEFEISEKKSNSTNEYEGTSEISDSQREIRPSKIIDIAFSKENDPKKYLLDKDEQKSKQTDSTATISEYTTPSKLLQKYQEREGVQMNSPGYGAFEYSTPSTLIQTRESEPSTQHPDHKESLLDYTTPSKLLQKNQEREGVQMNSPGYGAFEDSTPSTLIQRRESEPSTQHPDHKASLPDYTTPSKLLQKYQEREGVQMNSPGYGAFEYSTPSTLIQRRESEPSTQHPDHKESLLDSTTPSKLLQKNQEREGVQMNSPGYGAFEDSTPSTLIQRRESEPSTQHPDHKASLPDYTTPSKLLQKYQEREGVQMNSPGYGAFEYSTPSTLIQRRESEPSTQHPDHKESLLDSTTPSKLLQKNQEREGVQMNSPGYGAFEDSTPSTLIQTRESEPSTQHPDHKASLPDYTTPSKLLKKYQEREGVQMNSPGYGAFEYSTPSTLIQTRESEPSTQHPDHKESLLDYTTPSKLLQKNQEREGVQMNSPGYGAFEYSTPSTLIQRRESEPSTQHPDHKASLPDYTTPSKLLQNYQEREGVQMNSPGYGAFEYSTPSTLIQRRESEPSTQHPDNTTTSELNRRSLEANKSHERNPGFYFFNYSTPSQMVEKRQQQNQIPVSNTSFPDNTTPSQLLRSEQDLEERRRKSPGYGVFDYTTPSQLMWARENAPSGSGLQNQHVNSRGSDSHVSQAKPLFPGLGTFSYTTPSQLGMQSQPSSPACLEHRDSGLLQTDGSRPGTKQDLDPALSDITTYFRELSDRLISVFPESFSEPDFIKQHPVFSGNRFCPQNTDSYSDTGQRQPMPSQPLSVTGSTYSHKTYSPATGMSTDSGFGHSGRDSASSLSYPDSVFTPRDSSLRVTSNLSFDAYSDDEEHPSEEKRTMPKSLHLALSANEIFWKLFSANPSLSLHVLGSEFDTALHTLNQLYSSYCSGHPSTPPIPVNPVVPRGPVSASALSTTSVNPAAPYPFHMTPDRHTSQEENFHTDEDESRPGDVQRKMSSSMSVSPHTSDIRNFMVEKEKMESQMRKLQVENSTLVMENKLMKEKFNRASAKVTELEQKLSSAHNEMDSLQTSMTTEISTLYDKTRSEAQRDMDQFQTRIVSLTRHNDTLQAEVLSLEKLLESSQREADAIRTSAERSRAFEAYKIEANSLKSELDHVKMLLQQSESQVKAEIDRAQNAQHQVVKLTEIRNLLQQQIDSGGVGSSVAEKQNLREMKGEYENKLHHVEEKIEDIRSEKMAFENMYKEQLSVLVKEKHEACARLQTLEDMMEAMKKENDMLRLSLASAVPDCNAERVSAEQEARVEHLTLEIHNLTGQTSQLQRNTQQMQTEIETLQSQLKSRDQELLETRSQLDIAHSRKTDDSDNRRQHKIDQLTAQVSSLQNEVKSLSDRLGSATVEKNHLEKQLEDASRQLTLAKSRSRDLMAAGITEAKVRMLEGEVAQKEREMLKMTAQIHESDMALQQTRQDLGFHQQHIADLEGQVESLEQQVMQRGQMLETVRGKEEEQLQQFQLVKYSLDAATNSLNQSRAEFNMIQLELSKEQSRREAVERELHHARQPRDPDADVVTPEAGSAMEVRVQELENELNQVRGQLVDAASVLQCKEEELSGERTEMARAREDLERERTTSCQMSAEKVQLHQQLQALSEERNSLLDEKGQAEEDLVKLESRLQEVVHKFQMEASKQHDNFNTAYPEPQTAQDKQMLSELMSLRLLVGGREKESMSLNDKISRQQMETGFLQHRVELLRQENQYNQEDVRSLSSQLLQKMKEKTATVELNTYMAREKSTLQHENKELTRDIERERDFVRRRKAEVSEVIKKMEKSESSQRDTVQELNERQGHIASLETDLRQAKRENTYLDTENQQLKVKVDQLKEEVQKLTSISHSLENRLEMEQASLAGERGNYAKKKEELVSTQHKLDTLQREQNMLLNNLDAERKQCEQLKEEVSSCEASERSLQEQLNSLQADHDSQRGQNLAHRDNLEQLKKEKTAIFQDYQDVCRQLGEKEKKMCDVKDECERKLEAVKRDATLQRTRMDQERESIERDLKTYKEEISELNEKLRLKDVQLNAFGRTLTQLEDVTREKKSLEVKVEKMESAAEETKYLLEANRTEILGMKETHSQLQESLAKTQMNYLSAQEQLRTHTDSTAGQVLHLKHTISELKTQHEGELAHLREALNQAEANHRSVEMSLRDVAEKRDELDADKKSLERSFEEVKGQVAEEVMNRKLLEQRSESQKSHLENTKKKKHSLEEKTAEQLARLARVESELQMERERVMTLTGQVQELEAGLHGNQSAAKAKQEQVDILQSEVGKLQRLLDTQKQQLGGKYRKANLEIKQHLETSETEKAKLSQEAQQLSVHLEQAREQIAIKNKENLRLQEEILSLEDQVRENSSQLKQAMDSIRIEEQMQSDLNSRFSEQEEELRRLRTFLARKAEEGSSSESKGMWQEMNRVIQDLSRQMHQHMESQKCSDKEARDREIKLANSFKKQVATLESELKTERALHQITRSSLKSQEDDNSRLRDQMFSMRRKSTSPEKKYKSRSEEINELISRSQSRAQAILSSGAYTDGTLKNINPTKDYNFNSNDLDRSQSPDTASQMSDISCGSNGPVYLAFLNSSGTWQTPGSGNVTPRKSP